MMRDGICGALVIFLAAATAGAGPPDWAAEIDATELRARFGARADFYEVCEQDRPLEEAWTLLAEKSWEEALALSTPWLEACPVDIDFHTLRRIALGELGRDAEAAHHDRWRTALLESVLASGTGASPESALVVISVPEEYAVLRALGMRFLGQDLSGEIDRLTVELDGRELAVYFHPAAHFRRLEKKLGLD